MFLGSKPRCNMSNRYVKRYDEPSTLVPPCTKPPTVRYRTPEMVEGHWNYRCEEHARILNAPGMVIEPLED